MSGTRGQVTIQRRTAEAWLAFVEGRRTEAVTLMKAAADLDDAAEKHPVTPGSILPAREQLGELLLEAGRPAEARVALGGLERSRRSPVTNTPTSNVRATSRRRSSALP